MNISDPLKTLDILFQAEPEGRCRKARDANDDGAINISDPVYVLNFLFAGSVDMPQPFPQLGRDDTADALRCLPAPISG